MTFGISTVTKQRIRHGTKHLSAYVDITFLNRSETAVSWHGTEFYTQVDVDIIPLNRHETTLS